MPNGAAAPAIATGASASAARERVAESAARGNRGNWRELAACRVAEPELFFPAASAGRPGGQAAAERAKAVCGACPVRRECLQFALATRQRYGIWGGMSEHERRVAPAHHLGAVGDEPLA